MFSFLMIKFFVKCTYKAKIAKIKTNRLKKEVTKKCQQNSVNRLVKRSTVDVLSMSFHSIQSESWHSNVSD